MATILNIYRRRGKTLSVKEYLNKFRSYLKDTINDLKRKFSTKFDRTWKIQLTIAINFMSSKDHDQRVVIDSRSNNRELMITDKEDNIIKELFQSLLSRNQFRLESSMKVCNFIFDCVNLLQYKCHIISFKHGRSYVYSSDWTKKKKATINPTKKNI